MNDDIFPEATVTPSARFVDRRRPSAPRSDFDDPAVRAKYLPGGIYGDLFNQPPREAVGPALVAPDAAAVGECCHGLTFGTPWPRPGDERHAWGQTWRCEAVEGGWPVWRRDLRRMAEAIQLALPLGGGGR